MRLNGQKIRYNYVIKILSKQDYTMVNKPILLLGVVVVSILSDFPAAYLFLFAFLMNAISLE
jgi:hypothetical protein